MAIVVLGALGVAFLTLAQPGTLPSPGQAAPALALQDPSGSPVSDAGWRGRRLVLHFHPQDETPECLEILGQLQGLNAPLEAAGIVLVPIGVAKPEATADYRVRHSLALKMWCDPQGHSARSYGALVNLGFMRFARKTTVVIDPSGRVEQAWRDATGPEQLQRLRAHLGLAA